MRSRASRPAGGPRRASSVASFRTNVWKWWKENGRHELAWRKTRDPYRILVSEVMLQQTQVSRVAQMYPAFLQRFPTVRALARASLADVLGAWSGLGYNRRAKYLHDAAIEIVRAHKGKVPKELADLRKLPGMGPYTASAVRVFAYGLPDVLLETNVRSAFIHHFFPKRKKVSDTQLMPLLHDAAAGQDPRKWHWALMDYGVCVKKLHQNPSRRSAHYGVQSKFEGSLRQIRGAILKVLREGSHGDLAISRKLAFDEMQVRKALSGLARDGLVTSEKGSWRIA